MNIFDPEIFLGIDYGNKRVGLAVADSEMKIATPLGVISNKSDAYLIEEIKKVLQDKNISYIVVGMPLNLSGKETRQTMKVEDFVLRMRKETNIEIYFENEIFSSALAKRFNTKKIDEAAAAVILQSYIDKKYGNN